MPVLEPDSTIRLPDVTVLKASAGSGKTWTLTERYVQFALSGRIPRNGLRNILAITFSNNAAREMKENVLLWLKSLAFADAGRLADISDIVSADSETIRGRAGGLIEEILDRYSDFQVRTIDSFMSSVFRASALDFGFASDMEVLLDPAPLLEYAFNALLREAREGRPEARLLDETVRLMLTFKDGGGSFPWDPASLLLAEMIEVERRLSLLPAAPRIEEGAEGRRRMEARILHALEELEAVIDASGLERSRTSTFRDCLEAARRGRFSQLLARGMKASPVKKPRRKDDGMLEAYERIGASWSTVDSLVGEYAGIWARSFYAPCLRLHRELAVRTERAKRNESAVFIGDITRTLGDYLSREIIPDVYFRLGEAIFHYLIDEFQDTSPAQWQNLFPLIENSLAEGGSLFVVGDTKQAIYGFRQADYTIMRALEVESPFPSAGHTVLELSDNYRSRPRILAFVEEIFKTNAARIDGWREAASRSGLGDYVQKAREGAGEGYVELEILARDGDDPPERGKLQEVVRELHERGYGYGDMAILAARNEEIVRATSWLNEIGVPFISLSSLDVRRRKAAGEIISLLTFLDAPPDDLAFAAFILGDVFGAVLQTHGWQSNELLHRFLLAHRGERPLYKAFQRSFGDLWEMYFSALFRSAGYLPLYDLLCDALVTFRVFALRGEEEATFAKLLEVAKDFEGSGANSLRDFLSFASDGSADAGAWAIDVPQEADCVRAMTIHKAKGLGFPVVIVLLYGERSQGFEYTVEKTGSTGGERPAVRLVKVTQAVAGRNAELRALYDEETVAEKVNRLNGLYVALTRAKQEMYVIGVRRETDAFPFELLTPGGWAPTAEKPPVAPTAAARRGEEAAVLSHETRPAGLSSAAHGAPVSGLNIAERRRGELVHRILSLVHTPGADLEEVLARAAVRAAREARTEIRETGLLEALARLMRTPPLAELFTARPRRTVLTECELCDESGGLFRMDRVVVDADRVTVVDFKTGAAREGPGASPLTGAPSGGLEPGHQAQMRTYTRILRGAYPGREVRALVAYIDRGECLEAV